LGFCQVQRDVPVIRVDETNTASSLGGRLLDLTSSGIYDSGFPILQNDVADSGLRMVGYIGSNELDHALCSCHVQATFLCLILILIALVPADGDDEVHFHATYGHHWASSSISSFQESPLLVQSDPFDFTPYMDQVCPKNEHSFVLYECCED
jgi:chloride channel 3/4/5